ncbi:MAG: tetratricopeptide repeat protein [Chloroflexota bacterium]
MPATSRRPTAQRTEQAPPSASWAEAACQIAGFVVPLVFHTFGTVAFESTKVLLLRLLGLILAVGWLGTETGKIGAQPGPFSWWRRLGPVWHGPLQPVALGLLGIVCATAIAMGASLTPLVSLLGSWDRQQGLFTTLSWIVLGVAAALTGREDARRRSLVTVWALGSVPVCAYAVVQFAHLDPISWLNQPLGVSSTLGSSTALATYLAMLVALTLAVTVAAGEDALVPRPRPRHWRDWLTDARVRLGGLVALVVAQLAALAMTQVRGGWLAAAAGLLAMLAFALWPTRRRPVIAGGVAAVVVLLLAGVAFAALPRPDVGDGADTSARQRLLIWQDAVQALAGPRVLIGYGPETQMLALEPRFPTELAQRFEDARFDRAHNIVLDTLLTSGLLGLAALLLTVYGVVRAAFLGSIAVLGPNRWLTAGLLGALTANLVAGQFAFDTSATGALFWMVAGLLTSPLVPLAQPLDVPVASARQTRRQRRERRRNETLAPAVRLRATGFLAAGAVGLALVPWLTAPFLADLYHTRALGLRAGEAPGSSSRQELAAIQSVPWLDVPVLALADVFLDLARTSTLTTSVTISSFDELFEKAPSNRASLFEAARLSLERAVQLNPRDPYTHAAMARHWMMRGDASRDPTEQADLYGRAVESYDLAIEAGPSRVAFYDEAGVALTRWGRWTLALDRFKQADALSHPTSERLSRMADAMLVPGDTAGARALFEQALQLDARSAPAEAGLARLDRAAGNLPSALEHAQRAARFQMRNWQYQRDLALTLRDLGQKPEALVAARAARRLAPAWEQDDLTALVQSVSN